MSDKTTNYNFDTPGLDGAANIEVQDANWEKADTAIAAKVDKVKGADLFRKDVAGSLHKQYEGGEIVCLKDFMVIDSSGGSFSSPTYVVGEDNDFGPGAGTYHPRHYTKITSSDVISGAHSLREKANSSDVLTKTNTTEFTPTDDYNPATKKYTDDKVNTKVDKVSGKGLSANDFTSEYKTKLDNLDTNLNNKVDKVSGKGLSTNDFTSEYKSKLDNLDTNLNAKVINGSSLSSLTLTVSSTIPTTLAAGTICFIPEA